MWLRVPDGNSREATRGRSAAPAALRWAAMVLLSVAAAVVALPIIVVHDMFANQGWAIDFSGPLPAFVSLAVPVTFIWAWVIATVFAGVVPVVLAIAFRIVAWKDKPGPIGPVYTAFIASIAALAASVGAFLLDIPWSSLPAFVLIIGGGYWVEKRIGRRAKGLLGDEPIQDAT